MKGDPPFPNIAMPFNAEPAYEDGTNIARGTLYKVEPTPKVLPWYNPSESKASPNWKDKWSTLRDRFDRLIDEYVAVECVMIQTRIPACGHQWNDFPRDVRERTAILACGGLRSEPARLYTPDWSPLNGVFPIKSAKGEPILNETGEHAAFHFGAWRYFFVQPQVGSSPEYVTLPVPRLTEFARDGTSLLYQLPSEIALGLWRNWPSGFSKTENPRESLWLDTLFELSWQQEIGGPLHSNRSAWAGGFSYGLIGDGVFPLLPLFLSSKSDGPIPHEYGYPLAYYSKIEDVARASVAAIDVILERAELMNTSGRRFSAGLSFAGEHRQFMEQIAGRLASRVGKDRILYDKYHEAEFAQPDLDVYLPNLYRTECDLIAVFLCREYQTKRWCKLEWRFIRQLIATTESNRIMFLSFDEIGSVPELGILDGDGYISIGSRSADEIANLIFQRIQRSLQIRFPHRRESMDEPLCALTWRPTDKHLRVLQFVVDHEGLDTSLQEKAESDTQFVPASLCDLLKVSSPAILLELLRELELAGCLVCRSNAVPSDSTKFVLEWRLTSRGRDLLPTRTP